MRMFFFFNDTATTEIYTLSLHDALPIYARLLNTWAWGVRLDSTQTVSLACITVSGTVWDEDRKSTRLNSSHTVISYAVFFLKKKRQASGDGLGLSPAPGRRVRGILARQD